MNRDEVQHKRIWKPDVESSVMKCFAKTAGQRVSTSSDSLNVFHIWNVDAKKVLWLKMKPSSRALNRPLARLEPLESLLTRNALLPIMHVTCLSFKRHIQGSNLIYTKKMTATNILKIIDLHNIVSKHTKVPNVRSPQSEKEIPSVKVQPTLY